MLAGLLAGLWDFFELELAALAKAIPRTSRGARTAGCGVPIGAQSPRLQRLATMQRKTGAEDSVLLEFQDVFVRMDDVQIAADQFAGNVLIDMLGIEQRDAILEIGPLALELRDDGRRRAGRGNNP